MIRLLLFDLDGTLLRSDKTLSPRTLAALRACQMKGISIGVCTSRSEQNCLDFLPHLSPDAVISSGGAVVRSGEELISTAAFTPDETNRMIAVARAICGPDVELTVDTLERHYWNYKVDPLQWDKTWGVSVWTDYEGFSEECLKLCVQIFDEANVEALRRALPDCDMVQFSGSDWYKLTRAGVTKENAIRLLCAHRGVDTSELAAFGDDLADIGMLRLAGLGVAMGNALPEVKDAADRVIGTNDEDGIAVFLESEYDI